MSVHWIPVRILKTEGLRGVVGLAEQRGQVRKLGRWNGVGVKGELADARSGTGLADQKPFQNEGFVRVQDGVARDPKVRCQRASGRETRSGGQASSQDSAPQGIADLAMQRLQ